MVVPPGIETTPAGVVSIPGGTTIGYFNQKVGEMSGCSPVEQAVRCAGRVAELRAILAGLEEDLADPEKFDDIDRIMVKYAKVQDEFQVLGGYDVEARAREVLSGLGFSEERMSGEVGVLSGGWKMRVALAGILIQLVESRCRLAPRAFSIHPIKHRLHRSSALR